MALEPDPCNLTCMRIKSILPVSVLVFVAASASAQPTIVRKELYKANIGTQLISVVDVREIVLQPNQPGGLHRHPCPVVRYLHTRYMLVDPLGSNPLVVSGSANFSEASTTNNDENMLIIRGNPRVAHISLGEFMRLYRHFAFRDRLTQHPEADEVQVGHLDETDQWWKRYFGDSFESRQRSYFAR